MEECTKDIKLKPTVEFLVQVDLVGKSVLDKTETSKHKERLDELQCGVNFRSTDIESLATKFTLEWHTQMKIVRFSAYGIASLFMLIICLMLNFMRVDL